MARPKVAVLSHTYVVGTNRVKFQYLADHADITLIVPRQWRDALRVMPLDPLASDARYQLIALPSFFDGRLARFFFSPPSFWRTLHQLKPDLVHLEAEPIGLSFLQVALAKKYRLCFFTWQNIFLKTTRVEAFNLARADAAIAGNRAAARVLQAKGFRKPIVCVPQLGVDSPDTPGERHTHSPFRIGYVGRLVAEKGLLVLLDALARFDGIWELRVMGDGPLRATLEQLSITRGLRSRIQFIGALPHAQVLNHLRELDVLALPSLSTPTWKEQFGHVLIEAMACGVPVVGSDSGAIPEVVGDAGLIVPQNDADGLRAALERLMRDETLRVELSHRGHARVRSEYTHAQIARRTWDIWQKVLNP